MAGRPTFILHARRRNSIQRVTPATPAHIGGQSPASHLGGACTIPRRIIRACDLKRQAIRLQDGAVT
jgi:hypothetical protein